MSSVRFQHRPQHFADGTETWTTQTQRYCNKVKRNRVKNILIFFVPVRLVSLALIGNFLFLPKPTTELGLCGGHCVVLDSICMLLTGSLLLSGMLCCYDVRAHSIPFCDQYNTVYLRYGHFVGISVTWLIKVGVQNQSCVLRTSVYEGVKLERGRRLISASPKYLYTPFSHSPPILFCRLLFNSLAKRNCS